MHAKLILFLSFLTTALAYRVTVPSETRAWSDSGKQEIEWERVETDSETFAVVLDNLDKAILPEPIILATNVKGSSLRISVPEPKEGWRSGPHFRVNLVRDERHTEAILAQSNEFEIVSGSRIMNPGGRVMGGGSRNMRKM